MTANRQPAAPLVAPIDLSSIYGALIAAEQAAAEHPESQRPEDQIARLHLAATLSIAVDTRRLANYSTREHHVDASELRALEQQRAEAEARQRAEADEAAANRALEDALSPGAVPAPRPSDAAVTVPLAAAPPPPAPAGRMVGRKKAAA